MSKSPEDQLHNLKHTHTPLQLPNPLASERLRFCVAGWHRSAEVDVWLVKMPGEVLDVAVEGNGFGMNEFEEFCNR